MLNPEEGFKVILDVKPGEAIRFSHPNGKPEDAILITRITSPDADGLVAVSVGKYKTFTQLTTRLPDMPYHPGIMTGRNP